MKKTENSFHIRGLEFDQFVRENRRAFRLRLVCCWNEILFPREILILINFFFIINVKTMFADENSANENIKVATLSENNFPRKIHHPMNY